MRDYGLVFSQFWITPDIQNLSVDAKLLAIYLLTSTHTNMLGCFRLPIGYVAADLTWDFKRVAHGFEELIQNRFVTRDEETSWVIIHNFLKWNPIENPNQGKSIVKLFSQVPTHSTVYKPLINALLNYGHYLEEPFLNRLQTLIKPLNNPSTTLSKPLSNQEQAQEPEQDQEQEGSGELARHPNPSQSLSVKIFKNASPFNPLNFENEFVMSIPLNNNSEFAITQSQINEWQSLYPQVDILQALRNIRAWNLANPKKRKTKLGILKHISTWLCKDQDKPKPQNSAFSSSSLQNYNEAVSKAWLTDNQDIILTTKDFKHD